MKTRSLCKTQSFYLSLLLHGIMLFCLFYQTMLHHKMKPTRETDAFLQTYFYQDAIPQKISAKENVLQSINKRGLIKNTIAKKTNSNHAEHSTTKNLQQTILTILHSKIAAQKPMLTEDASNQKGRATIGFILSPDGSLTNITLAKSSGEVDLDNAAMLSVKMATPVKEAGIYLQKSRYFSVDVVFE